VDAHMTSINIDELLKILPRLVRENDTVKGAIITALSGVVATREDIKDLMQEMDKRFGAMQLEMDKRFDAAEKRFDAAEKRFDAAEKRFDAADKNFEAINKRFETVDIRFDAVENRLDNIDKSNKESFNKVFSKLDNLAQTMGVPFEQFARNVVSRILEGEGFPSVVLEKVFLDDKEGVVFPETRQIEIDGLSIEPPVIMEVTAVLQEREKVDNFIKKKEFVEQLHDKKFRGFFIATKCNLANDELVNITVLLHQNGCELINL
jgi:hypothetical protein